MNEEATSEQDSIKVEPLGRQLLPILIGLILDTLINTISSLPPTERLFVIVILGMVYNAFDFYTRHPKKLTISRRTVKILTLMFLLAMFFLGIAALLLGLSLSDVLLLMGWLLLMIITVRFAQALPDSSVLIKSTMISVASVSLGAALSMGGAPVLKLFVTGFLLMAPLTILNNCDNNLAYTNPLITIDIPPHGHQTVDVPALPFIIERTQNEIVVQAAYDQRYSFPVTIDKTIRFDDREIKLGESASIDLQDHRDHTLAIC